MEYALNNYTYRDCCGQSIRECDDCDCYTCKICNAENYEDASPLDEEICFECFLVEKEYREESKKHGDD